MPWLSPHTIQMSTEDLLLKMRASHDLIFSIPLPTNHSLPRKWDILEATGKSEISSSPEGFIPYEPLKSGNRAVVGSEETKTVQQCKPGNVALGVRGIWQCNPGEKAKGRVSRDGFSANIFGDQRETGWNFSFFWNLLKSYLLLAFKTVFFTWRKTKESELGREPKGLIQCITELAREKDSWPGR